MGRQLGVTHRIADEFAGDERHIIDTILVDTVIGKVRSNVSADHGDARRLVPYRALRPSQLAPRRPSILPS